MDATLKQIVDIPIKNIGQLEYLLGIHGFRHFSVYIHESGKSAVITFDEDIDSSFLALLGLISQVKEDMIHEADVDFMIELEKKLKTFSKHDEYIIRKLLKER
jgi:hypothetical protein